MTLKVITPTDIVRAEADKLAKAGAPQPIDPKDPLATLASLRGVAVMGVQALRELAERPVHYVWNTVSTRGEVVMLASGPSEGKTTLLFLLLAARANLGAPVSLLGHDVEPASTGQFLVLIEGEHSESSTARKLFRSAETMGVDVEAIGRIIVVARKAVRLGSPAWEDVVALCRAGLVSDIVLDTLARVAPSDANDEREQVAAFEKVAQAIEAAPSPETRPTAWIAAHTRKGGTGSDLADVSGSAQRTGQADTVLLLKGEKVGGKTVSSTVTFAKIREEPDPYPEPVTFSITADRRLVLVDRAEDDDRPLEERILALLELGPLTKSSIADRLGRSRADVDEAIGTLFTSRSIETASVTVRGRSHKAFKVRERSFLAGRLGGRAPQADE